MQHEGKSAGGFRVFLLLINKQKSRMLLWIFLLERLDEDMIPRAAAAILQLQRDKLKMAEQKEKRLWVFSH